MTRNDGLGAQSRALVLTEPQVAACAKVACGSETGGGITLLVGPAGVGKSAVLQVLLDDRPSLAAIRPLEEWLAADPQQLPSAVIVDDAHLATEIALANLLARARSRRPQAAVVLAGQGRLFTLVARDTRLEQAVRMRATLLPGGLPDSRGLAAAILPPQATLEDEAIAAIHEIAGGVPGAILRLVNLAAVVAETRPFVSVTAADIETIHRRLTPLAA